MKPMRPILLSMALLAVSGYTFAAEEPAESETAPAAAVLFRSTGPQVARVDREGRISLQSVTIARDDGATVELGSGVSAGDKLALNVSSQIGNGEIVRIHSVASPATPAQLTTAKH
jgi:hypothetical protein